MPEGWARLFTSDPKVVEATVAYITRVAPFYCLFGLGMTLSFASQGAGRMKAPFIAGLARLFIATVGGWFAVEILGWGPARRVRRHRRRHGRLRQPDRRTAARHSVGPRRSRSGRARFAPTTGAKRCSTPR